MRNLKVIMLAVLTLAATSCSKNDDTEAVQLTTQELLVSGKWYISSMGNQQADDCMKETYFHFVNENIVLLEEFGLEGEFCISGGLNNFNYSLNDPDIEIMFGNFPVVYRIESISNTELILSVQGEGQGTLLSFSK